MNIYQLSKNDLFVVLNELDSNFFYLEMALTGKAVFENKVDKRARGLSIWLIAIYVIPIYLIINLLPASVIAAMVISETVFNEVDFKMVVPLTAFFWLLLIISIVFFFKKVKPKAIKIVENRVLSSKLRKEQKKTNKNVAYYQNLVDGIAVKYNLPKELCKREGVVYVKDYLNKYPSANLQQAILSYNRMCESRDAEIDRRNKELQLENYKKELQRNNEAVLQELRYQNQLQAERNNMLGEIKWNLDHK